MPKSRNNKGDWGSKGGYNGLTKITTNISDKDYISILEFTRDGSTQAEHYRNAIRDYVLKERKKRKQD